MQAEPQKEHEWLQKLVGEWTSEYTHPSDEPGKPPTTHTGTETVRSVNGLWVVAEGRGGMPGDVPTTTLMTLGYDTVRKRYVGTWIGSMMTYLWVYDGEVDASGKVLTLSSDGPSMAGDGTMARYRDVIEFKSDDHRLLTAFVQDEAGAWQQFMSMEYRRKK